MKRYYKDLEPRHLIGKVNRAFYLAIFGKVERRKYWSKRADNMMLEIRLRGFDSLKDFEDKYFRK